MTTQISNPYEPKYPKWSWKAPTVANAFKWRARRYADMRLAHLLTKQRVSPTRFMRVFKDPSKSYHTLQLNVREHKRCNPAHMDVYAGPLRIVLRGIFYSYGSSTLPRGNHSTIRVLGMGRYPNLHVALPDLDIDPENNRELYAIYSGLSAQLTLIDLRKLSYSEIREVSRLVSQIDGYGTAAAVKYYYGKVTRLSQ